MVGAVLMISKCQVIEAHHCFCYVVKDGGTLLVTPDIPFICSRLPYYKIPGFSSPLFPHPYPQLQQEKWLI